MRGHVLTRESYPHADPARRPQGDEGRRAGLANGAIPLNKTGLGRRWPVNRGTSSLGAGGTKAIRRAPHSRSVKTTINGFGCRGARSGSNWCARIRSMESDPAAGVGVFAALAAGLVSFLSPCVLPLVPGYLSAVTGVAAADLERADWRRVLAPSLLFVASFSAIFILLGLTATGLGSALQDNQLLLDKIAARPDHRHGRVLHRRRSSSPALNREWHVEAPAGAGRATEGRSSPAPPSRSPGHPASGRPWQRSSAAAALSDSAAHGAFLLAVYSAGLAIPFLLTALAFTRMTTAFAVVKRHYAVIMAIGGVILIAMGVADLDRRAFGAFNARRRTSSTTSTSTSSSGPLRRTGQAPGSLNSLGAPMAAKPTTCIIGAGHQRPDGRQSPDRLGPPLHLLRGQRRHRRQLVLRQPERALLGLPVTPHRHLARRRLVPRHADGPRRVPRLPPPRPDPAATCTAMPRPSACASGSASRPPVEHAERLARRRLADHPRRRLHRGLRLPDRRQRPPLGPALPRFPGDASTARRSTPTTTSTPPTRSTSRASGSWSSGSATARLT